MINLLDKKLWSWDEEDLEDINDKNFLKLAICKICYCFKNDILRCKTCSYLLSLDCYNIIKNSWNKKCPHCKKNINDYSLLENFEKRFFNQYKVYCLLKDIGCNEVIKYDELEGHLKYRCKFKDKKYIILGINININEFKLFENQKTIIIFNNKKLLIENPIINHDFNKKDLLFKENDNLDKNKPKIRRINVPNNIRFEKEKYVDDIYEGEIIDFKKTGYGIYMYNNGNIYEGFWKNNLFHGEGIYKNKNSDFYLGNWINGKKCGFGEELINNNYYKGNYENNLKNGLGFYKWKNNNTYEGYYLNGKRNGFGISNYNDGSFYNGEWLNGEENGFGIEKYTYNNSFYEGYFKNGLKHGWGRYEIENNKKMYFGNWKNDKFHGYGIFIEKEINNFFEGFWKNNLKEGKGIETLNEGYYIGNYSKNKKNGFGRFFYWNGEIHEGEWINDKLNKGKIIDKEGEIKEINN